MDTGKSHSFIRKCVCSGRLGPCRAEFCANKNLAYAEKRDTSCMKIYRLITLERITGIYSWTRTKHIVLMGNMFCMEIKTGML